MIDRRGLAEPLHAEATLQHDAMPHRKVPALLLRCNLGQLGLKPADPGPRGVQDFHDNRAVIHHVRCPWQQQPEDLSEALPRGRGGPALVHRGLHLVGGHAGDLRDLLGSHLPLRQLRADLAQPRGLRRPVLHGYAGSGRGHVLPSLTRHPQPSEEGARHVRRHPYEILHPAGDDKLRGTLGGGRGDARHGRLRAEPKPARADGDGAGAALLRVLQRYPRLPEGVGVVAAGNVARAVAEPRERQAAGLAEQIVGGQEVLVVDGEMQHLVQIVEQEVHDVP
mmetsp:Transcript_21000/g.60697  ORF Transcript_21000/g.60697 Transcript_21000/m.60697 type:complete len:280 (+) Transcript_21000:47-886(+)